MSTVPLQKSGETLYFRPLVADDEIIDEIASHTGEKRSAVAQKLVHLALQGKQFDFDLNRKHFSKLDWLVKQEKERALKDDAHKAQIERLEAHAREVETILKRIHKNSHFIKVFVQEIYGLQNICATLLNQIFTRLIEYFSPLEIEKKNSVEFANRNILGLIKHSLSELEKIAEHHHLSPHEIEPEILYLFTKLDILKARLLPAHTSADPEKN